MSVSGSLSAQSLVAARLDAESPSLQLSWESLSITPNGKTPIFPRYELQRSSDLNTWETVLATTDSPLDTVARKYSLVIEVDHAATFFRLSRYTNLSGADLSRADLEGADLRGIDFSHANLSGAILINANLSGANMTNVNLQSSNLQGAILTEVNFFDVLIDEATVVDDRVRTAISGLNEEANVVINELRSTEDDEIELFNRGTTPVDISWWMLTDDNADNAPYVFPEGTVVDGQSYVVLKKGTHHDFGLGASDRLTLFSPTKTIDEAVWSAGAAGTSYCRIPNGTGAFRSCSTASFGSVNAHESTAIAPLWIVGGTQGSAPGEQFDEPNELAFDKNGNLWAGDVNNMRLQIFDSEGKFLRVLGTESDSLGQFATPPSGKKGPEAIAVTSDNQVYVVDRGGKKVNIYDGNTFQPVREIHSELFVDPTGLVIDSNDHFYVADQGTGLVHHFDTDGQFVRTFQALQADDATPVLLKTETLGIDEARDCLFASSEDASRIEMFELSSGNWTGNHLVELQSSGLPQPGRVVDDVEGFAVDLTHQLIFVSDEDNGRVLVHDMSDKSRLADPLEDYAFIGAFGELGSAPGEFLSADGITVMPERDRLAIADQGNFRIQVFQLSALIQELQ